MVRLGALTRQAKASLTLAAGLSIAANLLYIGQAWIVADGFGSLAAGEKPMLSPLMAAGAFLLLAFIRHALDALGGRIAFLAAQKAVAEERSGFIRRNLLRSPFAPDLASSAAGAAIIGGKVDLIAPFLSRYRLAAMKVSIMPFAILAAVATVSWVASLVLLISGPLIPVFMALVGMAARDASEKHLAETGTLNSLLLERLNALADIKLLNGREAMVDQFFTSADQLRQKTMAVLRLAFLSSTVLELFSALGVAMVAVYVGFSLLGTLNFGVYGHSMTLTEGMFMLLLAPEFFTPLRDLASAWHDKAAALAAAKELADDETKATARIIGHGKTAEPLAGPIEIIANGLMTRPSKWYELQYPDLKITAGEAVALTGPSGVGKSTLLALLAGLKAPENGAITVCGVPLDDGHADRWRARLCWIGQSARFLSGSIQANICWSQPYDAARMAKALDSAGLGEVIASLPNGIATRLGENGNRLSGGEARRVLLARAFYSHADLLFFDEPTADLDRHTAEWITRALMQLKTEGRTLLVATHDRRLAAELDREIRLEVAA
nr:thiol reductant ABC exporter subunit CydD [Allorhizobium sonneratiae]